MAAMRRFLAPALRSVAFLATTAAALLATAAAAEARAPSASDQGSLEWILLRLKRDREAEKGTKPASADPLQAYEKGEVAIEEWKTLTDRVKNKKLTYAERERSVSAILARFKSEAESGKLDSKTIESVKKQICLECLDLMVNPQDDGDSRNHIKRLLNQLLPNLGVNWSIGDSPAKRNKAYGQIRKLLRS